MNNGRNPMATATAGFPFKKSVVESITDGIALCVDQLGRRDKISTQNTLGGSVRPQVGEQWMVDRSLGAWTFKARLQAVLPVVSNLADLLNALNTLGLITYNTTLQSRSLAASGQMRSSGSLSPSGRLSLSAQGFMVSSGTAGLRNNPLVATGPAQILSGSTSVTVSHGLVLTPSRVLVSPTSSLGAAATWWADTKTATTFVVHLNVNPVQTVTFDWEAFVNDL